MGKTLSPLNNITFNHAEPSMLFSLDDEPVQPTEFLIETAMDAIRCAHSIRLEDLSQRIKSGPRYPDLWPGEHYRLLAGLVKTLTPQSVIEIGTSRGLSALALQKFLPAGGKCVTFDIIPWKQCPEAYLREEDFNDGSLQQVVENLCLPEVRETYKSLFQKADLIFIDAAKDGRMEKIFLDFLYSLSFNGRPLVVFDDIRLWDMLEIWRNIPLPKLDLTSFGHWAGTGLVDCILK